MAKKLHYATSNMAKRQEIKVNAALDLVLTNYQNNERASLETARFIVRERLKPYFGHMCADAKFFDHSKVQDFKQRRADEGAQKSTVNGELAILRRGLILAQRLNYINKAPHIELYHIGNSNRRTGFFEYDEFKKLCDYLLPDGRAPTIFCFYTGWRIGDEVLSLTWQNYDEAGRIMRLFQSKNGKGRIFPLDAIPELGELMKRQQGERIRQCEFIFPWQRRRYRYETFYRHWKTACELAGISRLPHDFRRTAVRNLIRAGVDTHIAMEITGHKTQSVFYRYDIINERDIRDGVGKLNEYLKERNSTPTTNDILRVMENCLEMSPKSYEISSADGLQENQMSVSRQSGIESEQLSSESAKGLLEMARQLPKLWTLLKGRK